MRTDAAPAWHTFLRAVGWSAAAAMAIALFTLGSRPEAAGLVAPPFDKVLHAAYYAAFAAFLWIAFEGRQPRLMFLICAGLGVLDELHQAFLPGRDAGTFDLLVDFLAAGATLALLHHTQKRTTPCAAS